MEESHRHLFVKVLTDSSTSRLPTLFITSFFYIFNVLSRFNEPLFMPILLLRFSLSLYFDLFGRQQHEELVTPQPTIKCAYNVFVVHIHTSSPACFLLLFLLSYAMPAFNSSLLLEYH